MALPHVTDRAPTTTPEILAPAGSEDAFAAALGSGADVVYLGLSEGFNARARSTAFALHDLHALVTRAHRAGTKLYLTLNTLVFEDELASVEALLREVIAAGVDALIVQDPAVAFLARRLCPELHVHASTQMTISSAEGARFAATLGIRRVVLPRELSTAEIARFTKDSPLPAEVFIHGALCMSWSGQCLTSEAFSGRSANRGQCSQACRMPYELVVDGELRPLGDTRYLLSPQDLAGAEALPELVAAGVTAVKIEGRYKNAAYVATTVDLVRSQRDAALSGTGTRAQLEHDLRRTQLTFSRGASLGFLRGDDHQTLVVGRTPKHRGVLTGRVTHVGDRHVRVALDAAFGAPDSLRAGMGVMFDVGDPEHDDAPGGPLFGVRVERETADLAFGTPGPDLQHVPVGTDVFLTGDPELAREAARRSQLVPEGRIALDVQVTGNVGEPLRVALIAAVGARLCRVEGRSQTLLQPARSGGLDAALLRDKLCAFGGTPLRVGTLDTSALAPGLHLPVSELKQLRRDLVLELSQQLEANVLRVVHDAPCLPALRAELSHSLTALDGPPNLVPLCRTLQQLQAVIDLGVEPGREVELDFMELVGLSQAVTLARGAGLRVTLATVRVQKPGEEGYDRRIAALAPDAVLVRHWGALMHFAEQRNSGAHAVVHGDFSLNVTNSLTACHLLGLGLSTVTASHDLDQAQLLALLAHTPHGRVALTLHHHIATFHNSHCVYAHLLSDGRDYRTCGRPCEQHRVALRDFAGNDHPVIVDVGCRNTVFNAVAQSAAPLVPMLLERGVRRFRVEFVWENAEQVTRTLAAYRELLQGTASAQAVLKQVGVHEQYGVTTLRR
jgi:U32 family peptidase